MTTRELLQATREVMQELLGPEYEVHGIAISQEGVNLRVSGLVTRGFTSSFGYTVTCIENVTAGLLRRVMAKPAREIKAQYVAAIQPPWEAA